MHPELEKYAPFAAAISQLLHPNAEVVVHDLETGCIAALHNNMSKREVGDPSLLEEVTAAASLPDFFPPYEKINWDGRQMRSVSITVRDGQHKAVGLVCINLDLSSWVHMQQLLDSWLRPPLQQRPQFLFAQDWQEKIHVFVKQYLAERGLALHTLSKQEARALVCALHTEGAFAAKNAAAYIARILNVSRATLYNYLRSL